MTNRCCCECRKMKDEAAEYERELAETTRWAVAQMNAFECLYPDYIYYSDKMAKLIKQGKASGLLDAYKKARRDLAGGW